VLHFCWSLIKGLALALVKRLYVGCCCCSESELPRPKVGPSQGLLLSWPSLGPRLQCMGHTSCVDIVGDLHALTEFAYLHLMQKKLLISRLLEPVVLTFL
jgi:hypothetical protein